MMQLTGVSRIVRPNDLSLMGSSSKLLGPGGSRRVHQDGVLMLDKHLSVKDTAFKVSTINRLYIRIDRDNAKPSEAVAL